MNKYIVSILAFLFLSSLCGAEVEDALLERKTTGVAKVSTDVKDEMLRQVCVDAIEDDYACKLFILSSARNGVDGIGKFSVEVIQKVDNQSVAARLQGKKPESNKSLYHCVITGRDGLLDQDIDRGLTQKAREPMGERIKQRVYRRCVLTLVITGVRAVEIQSCVLDEKFSSDEFIKLEALQYADASLEALLGNPDEMLLKDIPRLATKETERSKGKMSFNNRDGNVVVSIRLRDGDNMIRVYDLELNVWSRPRISFVSIKENEGASKQIAIEYAVYSDLLKAAPSLLPKGGIIQAGNDIWSSQGLVNRQKDGQYEVSLDVHVDDGGARQNCKLIGICVVNADGSIVWSSKKIRR